jgi:hypothetical protein
VDLAGTVFEPTVEWVVGSAELGHGAHRVTFQGEDEQLPIGRLLQVPAFGAQTDPSNSWRRSPRHASARLRNLSLPPGRIRADTEDMLRVATVVRQVYLDCQAPFEDEQIHLWVFIYDFLTDYMHMVQRWAQRTRLEVESWSDLSPDGKRERAMALFERKRPARWLPGSAETEPPRLLPGQWRVRHSSRTAPDRMESP